MIESITAQEAFNKNWQHFIVEGNAPGYTGSGNRGSCLYRSPDGCRCGIGVLIPDELYSSAFEVGGATALMLHTEHPDTKNPNKKWGLVQELFAPMRNDRMGVGGCESSSRFLSDIQYAHDMMAVTQGPGDNFKRFYADNLRALAVTYTLEVPAS